MVKGEHRGRVVYIDEDYSGPHHFPPVASGSFIEWYMGWLRECAAGYAVRSYGYVQLGSPDELMARYNNTGEEERLSLLFAVRKAWKEGRYLPVQGPGISKAVEDKLFDILHNDESVRCRRAALTAIVHFESGKWKDEVAAHISDPVWVSDCSLTLHWKYQIRMNEYWPEINEWYEVLVSALPAAMAARDDEDGKYAMHRIVSAILACDKATFEDIKPYMDDDSTLQLFADRREIPEKHWEFCFTHIREGFNAFHSSEKDVKSYAELRQWLFMIRDMLKKTPGVKDALIQAFHSDLLKLQADFAANSPVETDEYIRNNVDMVLELLK